MKNIKDKLKFIGYEAFKLVVFAILLSFIIPTVNADIRTDLWLYSNLTNSAADSSGNSRSGTVNGATAITSGGVISGTGYYYFTTNDYISYNGYGMLDNGNKQNFTINIWVDANTDAGFYTIWSEGCTTDDDCIFTARGNADSDGKAEQYFRDQDGTVKISSVENTRATFNQTWTMLTWVRAGANWRVYVNGQSAASGTGLTSYNVANFNTFNLGVLQRIGLALYMEGNLSEFGVWNRTFNSNDVSGLYSMYLAGCNPINNATLCGTSPPPPTTTGRLTADAKNGMDLSTINIFNVTVKQSDGVLNGTYAVTNGLLNISLNPAYLYNITGYFSNFINRHTLKLVNITSSKRFFLWESEARFTAKELYTNANITGFTVYNNYLSNSSTPPRLYFNNGTYNLTATKTLYQNAKKSITMLELQNKTENFTFYKYINVTAYNGKTGDKISGLNVTLRNTALGVLQNNYTTGNQFLIPVGVSTWNITVYNNSFARNFGNSKLITLNSSSYATTNLRFDLFTTNSFDITFKDEQTLNNITGSKIFIDLIGSIYSANYSTTTGNLYADLLTPDTYTIRYYGTGYQPRTSTYTLTDTTYNQITLYLLSASSNVSLYVLDDTRQPVEAAQIKVYRYSVVDNAYILVNTINTDYEGKAIIDAQKNSEFYRFYIYHNGELKLSTQPAYITSSEIVFTISTRAGIMEDFFRNQADYTYSCDYNIVTRNFKFYYDTQGEASQGCLYLYTVSPNGFTTDYSDSCSNSESATILLNVANTSGVTYLAKGYITVNGDTDLLCTNSYSFINNAFVKSYGNFFIIFMVILFATVGFFSLPMAFILTPIPLVFGSGLGLISVPMAASVGMCVLGVALAVVIQRRG